MRDDIEQRVISEANYILSTKNTIRGCAKYFAISKSTVHKDVTERLSKLDKNLYLQVKGVLNINKAQRHIRGGMATKRKYEAIYEKKTASNT